MGRVENWPELRSLNWKIRPIHFISICSNISAWNIQNVRTKNVPKARPWSLKPVPGAHLTLTWPGNLTCWPMNGGYLYRLPAGTCTDCQWDDCGKDGDTGIRTGVLCCTMLRKLRHELIIFLRFRIYLCNILGKAIYSEASRYIYSTWARHALLSIHSSSSLTLQCYLPWLKTGNLCKAQDVWLLNPETFAPDYNVIANVPSSTPHNTIWCHSCEVVGLIMWALRRSE